MADLNGIRQRIREELEPSTHSGERGKYYICPLCRSGDHGAGSTAAFSIDKDGIHGHCFACGFHGDIFDLVAARERISLSEATQRIRDKYEPGAVAAAPARARAAADQHHTSEPQPLQGRDIPGEVEGYSRALLGSRGEKYLAGRGFTVETMKRFRLGYDSERQRITIPYNQAGTYYDTRAINPDAAMAHGNLKGVKMPLFNPAALYAGELCFIVESPLCAISIEQEGGSAAAISGISGMNRLREQLEKRKPSGTLVLSLDNDERGREGQGKLAAMLQEMGITFIEANVAGDQKDPNDLLQAAPDQLRENIAAVKRSREEAERAAHEAKLQEYNSKTAGAGIAPFFDEVEASKTRPAIPTGFPGLDKLMEGGLFPGLYIIGAITSLGKTTFTLQIADNVAAAGHDVLFFSLEMAQRELMAKSLSRLTFQLSGSNKEAKTTFGILNGSRWINYSRKEVELIAAAADRYKETSGAHIWFMEGVGNIGVEQIRARVTEHISTTGRKPVVVIDYLQILAPADIRASDKQNTDKAVLELKRLSRDYGIPVFGISSLNRDNYTAPINNAAFKESGAIEYSCDMLLGLQFYGMDYQEGEAEKAREKRIRELVKDQQNRGNDGGAETLQLKVLKFRNGRKGTDLVFDYYPWFNCYREREGYTVVQNDQDNPFTQGAGKTRRPI